MICFITFVAYDFGWRRLRNKILGIDACYKFVIINFMNGFSPASDNEIGIAFILFSKARPGFHEAETAF